ncbi:hypothetical protein AYO38_02290 [bacterium SCGC AG-212-C10]|nr:hypothetical protein AYO38_02290 [bacterium SCGC AG-212-C10]
MLAHLTARIDSLPRFRPILVAIDGRSAAGKTSLADELAEALRAAGREVIRVEIDDFHRPAYKERAIRGDFTPESYVREGYDFATFRRFVLDPLAPGGSRQIRTRYWNWQQDEPYPDEAIQVADGMAVIVDGIYLLLPELDGTGTDDTAGLRSGDRDERATTGVAPTDAGAERAVAGASLTRVWDLSIWVEVDWETMIERAMQRDIAWTGDGEVVRDRYVRYWIPRHQYYETALHPRDRADIVIDNTNIDAPAVLRGQHNARPATDEPES